MSNPLQDFFNFNKPMQPIRLRAGATQGLMRAPAGLFVPEPEAQEPRASGMDYAAVYRQAEDCRTLLEAQNEEVEDDPVQDMSQSMDADDIEDDVSELLDKLQEELGDDDPTAVYNLFNFVPKKSELAIEKYRRQLLATLEHSKVVILKGFTGCGKSTQAPQFVLDHYAQNNLPCNIVVTQPRRIAAKSLAERVCHEREWLLGTVVGYQVGLDKITSKETRLTYCTTGVLLQKIINKKRMDMYTHIFLDEVHERNKDVDITMLLVRKFLRSNCPHVKVILMSATIDVCKFADYFASPAGDVFVPAPIIEVVKTAGHTVHEYYLSELKQLGDIPLFIYEEPELHPEVVKIAVKLMTLLDTIEGQDESQTLDTNPNSAHGKGAVLMFLPGINEIGMMKQALEKASTERRGRPLLWWILPLHSTITDQEQKQVFCAPQPGYRKMILSTNIAESSITVPDIKYVIDFCLTKHMVTDFETNLSQLRLEWISKANCKQRSGRVGRVSSGRVYRMVPNVFYEKKLKEEAIPEILRTPLEQIILHIKSLDLDEPKALLALALDPPDILTIENTILLLKETGALLLTQNGKHELYDGNITFLGKVMANLPVDIRVSKLIMLGYVFNMMEECIIIGAGLSLKNPFSSPFGQQLTAYHSKFYWANGSFSDCIALMFAYKVWAGKARSGQFDRPGTSGERSWARRVYLQEKALKEQQILIKELKERLSDLGVEEPMGRQHVKWNGSERSLMLKLVLAGAFYPNYFFRGSGGSQVDEREAVKQLAGRDPSNTVMLHGMPFNQPGHLYIPAIKHALRDCASNMKISFESERVYVEFPKSHLDIDGDFPGKIATGVYKAVKMRFLESSVKVNLFHFEVARLRAEEMLKRRALMPAEKFPKCPKQVSMPAIDSSVVPVFVTHVKDPHHFWVQFTENRENLEFLEYMTQRHDRIMKPLERERAQVGSLYLAPFQIPDKSRTLFRVQLRDILEESQPMAEVFFIDYGNVMKMRLEWLREIPDIDEPHGRISGAYDSAFNEYEESREDSEAELVRNLRTMPMQAVECVLAEVAQNPLHSDKGSWGDKAIEDFRNLVCEKSAYAVIYSVVNSVMAVNILLPKHGIPMDQNILEKDCIKIAKKLIDDGLAVRAEESFLSKKNHAIRVNATRLDSIQKKTYEEAQMKTRDQYEDCDPNYSSSRHETMITTRLRGPYSPLEMRVFNLSWMGQNKKVKIENTSVNSVLLDTDPSDPHDRMVVAAYVGLGTDTEKLIARHTTILPTIPGLPAIISMLFAPVMELRTDEKNTCYTGALCGLGCNDKGRPIFQDHDMEIPFDVVFDNCDILGISLLRLNISRALRVNAGGSALEFIDAALIPIQKRIHTLLFVELPNSEKGLPAKTGGPGLLRKQRDSMEPVSYRKPYQWMQQADDLIMELMPDEAKENMVYPTHTAVSVKKDPELPRNLLKNLEELHAQAKESNDEVNSACLMCGKRLLTSYDVLLHLQTASHLDNEAKVSNLKVSSGCY